MVQLRETIQAYLSKCIFDSGETEKTFAVMATDDDEIEDDESVAIRFGEGSRSSE